MASQAATRPTKNSPNSKVSSSTATDAPPPAPWLLYFPSSWIPFIQLTRLDRFLVHFIFYAPFLYGVIHGSILTSAPLSRLLFNALYFFPATLLVRGAVDTWNDLMDVDYDRKVARTQHRAIARGAVSHKAAILWSAVQWLGALAMFLLKPPYNCSGYVLAGVGIALLYPFAKRACDFPQAFAALLISWSFLVGEAVTGSAPVSLLLRQGLGTRTDGGQLISPLISLELVRKMPVLDALSIGCFWASQFAWTFLIELVYAHQDVADDIKAGVGTLIVHLQKWHMDKPFLYALAIMQTGFLLASFSLMGQGATFSLSPHAMVGSLGPALVLIYRLWWLRLDKSSDCGKFIVLSPFIEGQVMLFGLFAEYYLRYYR